MTKLLRNLADSVRTGIQSLFPRYRHFVALARLDRPIGIYLLLWPTLSALWLASAGWPGWHLLLVFTLGTGLARSAGCVMNDIADRNYDGLVKRTRNRPLASGDLKFSEAIIFMCVLCFCALLLVLTTNLTTIVLAFVGVLVTIVYPYMKRFFHLPQVMLGIAFSLGIPMAYTAVTGGVSRMTGLLFIANMLWIVAYDTEYAMVDRDDDIKLGLRSSAILFGDLDRLIIAVLQILSLFTLWLAAQMAALHWPFYTGLVIAIGLCIYQQYLIRERQRDPCFTAFLNNHWLGMAIFLGIVIDLAFYP